MKLAINTNCMEGPLEGILKAIHQLDCRYVELSTNQCHGGDFRWLDGAVGMLEANDMECVCFSAGWTDLARGEHAAYARQAALASQLKAPYVRLFASNPKREAEPTWAHYKQLLAELELLSWTDRGPEILVENEEGLTSNAARLLRLLRDGRGNFGLLLDPANLMKQTLLVDPDSKELDDLALEELHDLVMCASLWIKHIHMKDVDRDGKFCLIGDGIIPWDDILKLLVDVGYEGKVSIEHEVPLLGDSWKGMCENYSRARTCVECAMP